jgi:hypothetical protein
MDSVKSRIPGIFIPVLLSDHHQFTASDIFKPFFSHLLCHFVLSFTCHVFVLLLYLFVTQLQNILGHVCIRLWILQWIYLNSWSPDFRSSRKQCCFFFVDTYIREFLLQSVHIYEDKYSWNSWFDTIHKTHENWYTTNNDNYRLIHGHFHIGNCPYVHTPGK